MIVFVNGPFGVGKTTVARLLVRRIPRARLYDPELIGGVLHRTLKPFTKVEDYQDYTLWRRLVVGGARLFRTLSERPLVIPMTIWKRDVFDSIVTGLRGADTDLSCFRLTASREALVDRILSDTEDTEAYPWRASHLEVSFKASRDPAFGREIPTEDRTPTEVADRILECLPLHAGWSGSR